MEIYDIVKTLIGDIKPVGETNEDERRYQNLEATIKLVDFLLDDIKTASDDSNRQEFSMKKIGKRAKAYWDDLTNQD